MKGWRHALRRGSLCLAGLLALLSLASDAEAEEGGEEALAREQFERGVAAAEAGDHGTAAEAFQQSYDLFAHPSTLVNLAIELDEVGQTVESFQRWRELLDRFGSVLSEATRQRARNRVVVLERELASVSVSSNVPGAIIVVDGEEVGTTPLDGPIHLQPGDHTFAASLDGYGAERIERSLSAGPLNSEVAFELTSLEAAPTETPPPPPAEPPRSISPVARWLTLGLGLSVAVGGTIAFIVGASNHSEVNDASHTAGALNQGEALDMIEGGNAAKLAGVILWGVGGALTVTSVILIALHGSWQRSAETGSFPLSVGFAPSPEGAFLSLGGRF